jgi:(R)-2-hydroxyacyl-CoA dehydratese activating ATPase
LYFAGVDIGSTMTKVVIIRESGEPLSIVKGPTGPEHRRLANEVMTIALTQANLQLCDIDYIVATGYGRFNVPFADRQITELTCHAQGVFNLFPGAKTVIDIGGQDVKCMKIENGKLSDFVMNDKCAAGTGRFLEVIAATLGTRVEDLGDISLKSTRTLQISNFCTIFAQQEVVSRLSEGESLENILAGLHAALASRVAALAERIIIEPSIVLTGGVAQNIGIVRAMKEKMGRDILIPDEPLMTGALGAAILAKRYMLNTNGKSKSVAPNRRRLEKTTFLYG